MKSVHVGNLLLRWKIANIIYSECLFVATSMQCACAVYFHLWPVWLFHIFPRYLINGTIFERKVSDKKICVLIFSTTFVCNISHSKKNWARYNKKKSILVFMHSNCYSCQIVMQLEFYRQIFFLKNTRVSNFINFGREGADLLHADGQSIRS